MSDKNIKTDATIINNEPSVNARTDISENPWVIRVSKTHPGLKYYFNTVTGVSLWNIRREDIERAKQTMNANANHQNINCPEPKDPPPNRRTSTNRPAQSYCEHIYPVSKTFNKQFLSTGLNTSSFACDICNTSQIPQNVISVNFQHCPHSTCVSPFGHKCSSLPLNQVQSSIALFGTSISESSHCNSTTSNLLGSKRSLSRRISETTVQDFGNEHLHNQDNYNNDHNINNFGFGIDVSPLKVFAKNDVIKDKWYIIADANVYLHHITFLKSLVNSDNQCCLMIPHHVKNELENATKTELRTKAHSACYYIYKMFDYGFARIDEDNSEKIQDESNEKHILYSCSKLTKQNFYVVILSNDLELQKCKNTMGIPIFTVEELKDYLCKSNHSGTTKSPSPIYNVVQNSPLNSSTSNLDPKLKCTPNNRSSLGLNDNETQDEGAYDVSKIIADVEVQTRFPVTQSEITENSYNVISLPRKKYDISNKSENTTNDNLSDKSLLCNNTQRPSKRIKLRRRKFFNQGDTNSSNKLSETNASESCADISNNKNILSVKQKLEDPKKYVSNTSENVKPNQTITSSALCQKSKETHFTLRNQALKPKQGPILQCNTQNEDITSKNVMFEVTTEVMEQSLKRKCDEWISRFVQIMEEALTQILRKSASYLPPPWNLYEATLCIGKKFVNDEDIADSTNNFLRVLNRITDKKGNVKNNINPKEYMEMYSFGVYVIDALQGIFSTCEDLQIAAESLSKLLSDIQNPDADDSNLEPFSCQSQHEICDKDKEEDEEKVEVFMIIETESISNDTSSENIEYPSHVIEVEPSENNISINNIERSTGEKKNCKFFTNIGWSDSFNELKKNKQIKKVNVKCNNKSQEDNNVISTETATKSNASVIRSPTTYNLRPKKTKESETHNELLSQKDDIDNNIACKSTFLSNLMLQKNRFEENPPTFEGNSEDNSKDVEFSDLLHKANTDSNGPKIVRNFVKCLEFENRLRNRDVYLNMEDLDYDDELMPADDVERDSSSDTGRLYIDEFSECHNNVEATRNTGYIKLDFKYFIRRIAQEIKELSSEVYAFSQSSSEALNSLSASDHKGDIREKAAQVHLCVDKLCIALRNILNRDKNGGCNVQAFLNNEFDDISVDEEQIESYGSFISRCLEQANELKNTIKDVLSAVCEL